MIKYRKNIKIKNSIKELEIWKDILKQLQVNNQNYFEAHNCEDSLYWYNERTNISSLAGAIWKLGGYALEEYSAIKGKNGRVDLYFYINNITYLVEAKIKWLSFNSRSKIFDDFSLRINSKLEEAEKDCGESLQYDASEHGMGILFIIPYWKDNLNMNEQLRLFEEKLFEKNYDIISIFAIDNKNLSNGYHVYNAVYIVGKYVAIK